MESCCPEHPVALQVEPGVLQQRLVPGHLSLGLGQLHLERPRVDPDQEISAPDNLPLLEEDLHQLTVHPGPDGDGVEGE